MDRIDRIFDRNTDIISAFVSNAFDYDMPISSKFILLILSIFLNSYL